MGFLNYYVLLYYDFLDTLFCNLFEIFKLLLVYMHPKNKENTNLCLQGQTVSDYQPLFSNLCIYLLKDFFLDACGRSWSHIPKKIRLPNYLMNIYQTNLSLISRFSYFIIFVAFFLAHISL